MMVLIRRSTSLNKSLVYPEGTDGKELNYSPAVYTELRFMDCGRHLLRFISLATQSLALHFVVGYPLFITTSLKIRTFS